MPLHAQAAAHLAATADAPPLHTLTVVAARRALRGYLDLQRPAVDIAEVRHTFLVGPGSSLPVRIYRDGPPGGPVILMLHGSGFVAADIELSDEPARLLARDTGATVVTVDYRKAPEHPYPAALDDAAAALAWIASGAVDVDVERIAVVGDSAGGTLTAALVQRMRDEGGPRVAAHAVLYPPLRPGDYDPLPAEEVGLSPEDMDWFWRQYLPDGAAPTGAAPLDADDFGRLPAAFIATAEYDVLRGQGIRYAETLRDAGVPVVAVDYPGTLHGFYWMDAVLDSSTDLQRDLAAWLRETLNGTR
ncbi:MULTISPECIES: alpha/beta hydrolase [Tsukamurella]|uniref:Alpha/beta hydrolase n=2 Tax=Tsukamurella TaxID=2060 RepID=A0A5C5RZN1_9ACTN|nr:MULTISPECIES: alpha/beta hydrolase [Tsukamurella]NMD54179.1 alpha/beta hydrolase [Tsukamurella columbiensis]TWS28294.1 alpha/beta hydrolase [Tsukamurella conjunctivitidis]